jgi:hypothetical protein
MKNTQIVVIAIVLIVVVAFFFFGCKVSCTKSLTEGYTATPGTSSALLKRSPVTYTYFEDGQIANPHTHADFRSKLIPLEVGHTDFWRREVAPQLEPITRQNVDLINDSRLRLDLYAMGDLSWAKTLDNQVQPRSGSIPGRWEFEMDAAIPELFGPLYSPCFHENAPFAQK